LPDRALLALGCPWQVHPPYPRRALDPAFQAGDPADQGPYSVFLPLPRTALYLFSAAWPCRVPRAPPRCTYDVNSPLMSLRLTPYPENGAAAASDHYRMYGLTHFQRRDLILAPARGTWY